MNNGINLYSIRRYLQKRLESFLHLNKKKKYLSHSDFWVQKINKKSVGDRFEFFKEVCDGRRVLHIGCTDWPIFEPGYNLHIYLFEFCEELHGLDIDIDGIKELRKYVDGPYYNDFDQVNNLVFDVCLVPETIEHVDNVRTFLEQLSKINSEYFYITAPNCFAQSHIERNYDQDNFFIEVVHPDHNCWYSPYTLKNQIEKYSNLEVEEIFLLNNDTMICCKAKKVNK